MLIVSVLCVVGLYGRSIWARHTQPDPLEEWVLSAIATLGGMLAVIHTFTESSARVLAVAVIILCSGPYLTLLIEVKPKSKSSD